MPLFRYKAAGSDGTVVEGRVEGESERAVRVQLEGQGLLLFSLDGPRTRANRIGIGRKGGHLSLREFLIFNQEFLTLVKAGLPILKTIDLLAERALCPGFKDALHGVRTEIRGGASISEAMARYPEHFSDLYRASIRSGEQTGNLVQVLQRYSAYLKLVVGLREKVVKALAYPVFLILVGVAVVAFLSMYVLPTFSEIYSESNAQLPMATQMLLAAVAGFQQWLPWLVAGTVGIGLLAYRWVQTEIGRQLVDGLSLRLPIVGEILLKGEIIRLARTLATVLASGIPLVNALQITGGVITNRVLSKALVRATDRVRDGMGLAASLKQEGLLPQITLEMIEVGETTGMLETILQDVAEFHEGELDLRLSLLTTWIEPVLLLVMGVLVGGIVIIMYLPVFQIAGTM